jgi:hypothetical protein
LRREAYTQYVNRVNWALNIVMGSDMANIGALVELRGQLLAKKNAIHQLLLLLVHSCVCCQPEKSTQVFGNPSRTKSPFPYASITVHGIGLRHKPMVRQMAGNSRCNPCASIRTLDWCIVLAHTTSDDALLRELVRALHASQVTPPCVSYERVVKTLQLEVRRVVDQAADAVREMVREQWCDQAVSRVEKTVSAKLDNGLTESTDGFHRPNSAGLAAVLATMHQAYIVFLFNLLKLALSFGHVGEAAAAKNARMFAAAETWRDMQNAIEVFVLSHLQHPRALGDRIHTADELLKGAFESTVTFNIDALREHASLHKTQTTRLNSSDHAGCDFIDGSPYHIMNIYNMLTKFADTGFKLLTAAQADMHLARGSHMLPTFVDDFVRRTFLDTIVQESDRLSCVAVQTSDAFVARPIPYRAWQPGRDIFKSCAAFVQLIETLGECARAMPLHALAFTQQITVLIRRYTQEGSRQVDVGARGSLAFAMVVPSTSGGMCISHAALSAMVQSQQNGAWLRVVYTRKQSCARDCGCANAELSSRADSAATGFTEGETEAMFRSEYAALSAAIDQCELTNQVVRAVPVDHCTLIACTVDALAYMCARAQTLVHSFPTSERHSRRPKETVGISTNDARCDPFGNPDTASCGAISPENYVKQARRALLSTSDFASDTQTLNTRSDVHISCHRKCRHQCSKLDREQPGQVLMQKAIESCWSLHDRYLLALRIDLRCRCFIHLRTTRKSKYKLDTPAINPEGFVIRWGRVLQRLTCLLKRCLPAEKFTFVLSGLPAIMAAVLHHHSGIHEGNAMINDLGILQMWRNVFALQQLWNKVCCDNRNLQAEDVFLAQFMKYLTLLHATCAHWTPQED